MTTRLSTIEEVSEYLSEETDFVSEQYQASGEESTNNHDDDLSHGGLLLQKKEPSLISLLGKRATSE